MNVGEIIHYPEFDYSPCTAVPLLPYYIHRIKLKNVRILLCSLFCARVCVCVYVQELMHSNEPILRCDCSHEGMDEERWRWRRCDVEDGEAGQNEGMMYDFNFRRTLVQKPAVLTVCPGVFFRVTDIIYTYLYLYWNTGKQYAGLFLRFFPS